VNQGKYDELAKLPSDDQAIAGRVAVMEVTQKLITAQQVQELHDANADELAIELAREDECRAKRRRM